MKRRLLSFFAMLTLAAFVCVNSFSAIAANKTVAVASIKMSTSSLTIARGASFKLSITVSPSNATNKNVSWSTSNASVASVNSKGVVTAKKTGSCTITAKSSNNKAAKCAVTVKSPQVTIVSVNPVSVTTNAGTAPNLPDTVTAKMSDGSTKAVNVSWSYFSPNKYAAAGTFTVNGTVAGSIIMATASVTVTAPVIVSINPVSIKTSVGKAPVMPETVTAKMSDGSIKTVSVSWVYFPPDKYAAVGAFTVNGTVAGSDLAVTATITVTAPTIVSINPVSVTTNAGIAPELPDTVTVKMSDGTTKTVSISWNNIPKNKYAVKGTFTVNGTLVGSKIAVTATVTVTAPAIVSLTVDGVSTNEGIAPVMPRTVTAEMSDGSTKIVAVTWDAISQDEYANPGSFEVDGTVAGADFKVTTIVNVSAVGTITFDLNGTQHTLYSVGNCSFLSDENSWLLDFSTNVVTDTSECCLFYFPSDIKSGDVLTTTFSSNGCDQTPFAYEFQGSSDFFSFPESFDEYTSTCTVTIDHWGGKGGTVSGHFTAKLIKSDGTYTFTNGKFEAPIDG